MCYQNIVSYGPADIDNRIDSTKSYGLHNVFYRQMPCKVKSIALAHKVDKCRYKSENISGNSTEDYSLHSQRSYKDYRYRYVSDDLKNI